MTQHLSPRPSPLHQNNTSDLNVDLMYRLAILLQLPMAFCDPPPGKGPWEGDSGRPEEPMGGRAPLE